MWREILFDSITGSIRNAVNKIRYQDDITALNKATAELKKALLKADVHHKTTKELINAVELQTKTAGIGQDSFLKALKSELTRLLTANGNQGFVFASTPPTTILMTGLQGSGKTTTTGKLANYLKIRKKKVLVAACDLQRLAAVEQLKQIAAQIEVDISGTVRIFRFLRPENNSGVPRIIYDTSFHNFIKLHLVPAKVGIEIKRHI